MEIGGDRWIFAYQFFPGSFQFQFWPSPGVPGATLVYPGSGDSPDMEIIVHRWVAYQFFPGYYQFQFWPNPGVPGATPVYPGPGLSLGV